MDRAALDDPELWLLGRVGREMRRSEQVWVPGVLRYVFAVLRHLPRPIYRRLPL